MGVGVTGLGVLQRVLGGKSIKRWGTRQKEPILLGSRVRMGVVYDEKVGKIVCCMALCVHTCTLRILDFMVIPKSKM